MQSVVERAAMGNKNAMQYLYESNRRRVYYMCKTLLNDDEAAEMVTKAVFTEMWKRLPEKKELTEVEFKNYLLTTAAKGCCRLLYNNAHGGFQSKTTESDMSYSVEETAFDGNLRLALNCFKIACRCLDEYEKTLILLYACGGLDVAGIAAAIGKEESYTKDYFTQTAAKLSNELENMTEVEERTGVPSFAQLKDLFAQDAVRTQVPPQIDVECYKIIESKTRVQSSPATLVLPIAVVLMCLVVVLSSLIGGKSKSDSSKEEASTTESSEINVAIIEEGLTYYADIEIEDYGTITIELDQASAPITVENFVKLCSEDFYDGLTFHRIIEGFMMQGGDPNGDGTGGAENNIVGEFTENGYTNTLPHTRGAVSMARVSAYDSASSQFFIVHEDSSDSLDGKYAVFGYVVEGMDIVDEICTSAEPTDGNGSIAPEDQPVIKSVTIRTE